MTYSQTEDELRGHLRNQLGFLARSSASFDNGFEVEAVRLAATIRVLLHDTAASKSLLGLLDVKDKIEFNNTAYPYDPSNQAPHQGLVRMQLQAGPGGFAGLTFRVTGETTGSGDRPSASTSKMVYVARASGSPDPGAPLRVMKFDEWWEEVVIRDNTGHLFTRRDITLAMANKDGGAHVDPTLNEAYADLTRFNSQGWLVLTEGGGQPPDNSLTAVSIRQIAHEVTVSIDPEV